MKTSLFPELQQTAVSQGQETMMYLNHTLTALTAKNNHRNDKRKKCEHSEYSINVKKK